MSISLLAGSEARDTHFAKNGPFDMDLVFAPDGIERFEDAWGRRVDVEGFPVCHIDDSVASKQAAGDLERHAHEPLLDRVWTLRNNLTAYDAVYVTLAEALGVRLWSCDARPAGAPGLKDRVDLV